MSFLMTYTGKRRTLTSWMCSDNYATDFQGPLFYLFLVRYISSNFYRLRPNSPKRYCLNTFQVFLTFALLKVMHFLGRITRRSPYSVEIRQNTKQKIVHTFWNYWEFLFTLSIAFTFMYCILLFLFKKRLF